MMSAGGIMSRQLQYLQAGLIVASNFIAVCHLERQGASDELCMLTKCAEGTIPVPAR